MSNLYIESLFQEPTQARETPREKPLREQAEKTPVQSSSWEAYFFPLKKALIAKDQDLIPTLNALEKELEENKHKEALARLDLLEELLDQTIFPTS